MLGQADRVLHGRRAEQVGRADARLGLKVLDPGHFSVDRLGIELEADRHLLGEQQIGLGLAQPGRIGLGGVGVIGCFLHQGFDPLVAQGGQLGDGQLGAVIVRAEGCRQAVALHGLFPGLDQPAFALQGAHLGHQPLGVLLDQVGGRPRRTGGQRGIGDLVAACGWRQGGCRGGLFLGPGRRRSTVVRQPGRARQSGGRDRLFRCPLTRASFGRFGTLDGDRARRPPASSGHPGPQAPRRPAAACSCAAWHCAVWQSAITFCGRSPSSQRL